MNALHYAVVVGINRYPALGDLTAAVGDAARFLEWLADPAGGAVPRANIELVPASADDAASLPAESAEPAVHQINLALSRVNRAVNLALTQEPSRWDETRLYIFVAGHGIAPDGGDGALLAANASLEELGHNIELSLYRRWYQVSCAFHELVVFADCCRSFVEGAPSNGPPFTLRGDARRPVRVTVAYASEFGRTALENGRADRPDQRRGYFTEALLRGLREAGDPRFGGRVTSARLSGFVQACVHQLASESRRGQGVEFSGVPDMTFGPPLAEAAAPHRVDIVLPESTGPVELLDGDFHVRERWDSATGPLTTKLPSGLYWVVRQGQRDAGDSAGLGMFVVAGADREVRL
ncbi:caspase family protein [Dactylosporangium sp. McL0621]|uniref:caspase family protein n=1 Tax=Dactylosporangium sp. McL0621 TaxID=3415678 RepID=UPI003CF9B045